MKRLFLLALPALLAFGGHQAGAQSSSGNYRIPYRDNIDLMAREDHSTHAMPNRVELQGVDTSTNTYFITAAASGRVRAIRDSGPGGTNYIWIEHPNGEWTGYFYLRTGSISARVAVDDDVTVGQDIGIESNAGSVNGQRLRFEVAVPSNPNGSVATLTGILSGTNRIPIICNIPGNVLRKNVQYTATDCLAQEFSSGIYRLPYSNTVTVSFNNDHLTHSPVKTRLDLAGLPTNKVHGVVAAAAGTIMFIMDTNTISCSGNIGNTPCSDFNNYVWIRHSNGEWSKYTHFRTGTVQGKAGLTNGQFVAAGTYLGDEGAVGAATGVHCHFEIAVPFNGHLYTNAFQTNLLDAFDLKGGFINGINRVPLFCNIPGNIGYEPETYIATPCAGGACVDDIVVPDRFIRGTDAYVAGQTVDTGNNTITIDTYGSLALYGGEKVTIRTGFRTSANSYLRAAVRPCINTP